MVTSQENVYFIKSKNISIILIISLLVCFISTGLGQIQAISDFNYTLHEMLFIPINLGIFLIPFEVIFLFYYSIRWLMELRRQKDCSSKSKQNILLNLTAFVCLFLFLWYFVYLSYNVSTSGIYEKLHKDNEGNKYYVVLQSMRVSCTRNEYNLIEPGRKYLIGYKWNKKSPETGKLEYIQEVK